MDKEEFFKFLENTYAKCVETSRKKNADYAGDSDPFANFRLVEMLGICSVETGILVRMTDKMARITNLLKDGKTNQVKDETVDDTVLDLSVYSVILMAWRKQKGKNVSLPDKK